MPFPPSLLRQFVLSLASCFPAAELARAADRPALSLPLAEWARRYCPAYFTRPPSLFHRWLITELGDLHRRRGVRHNVIAPRGAAKSTWVSFAYPLWCAAHGHEPYILLLSDSGDQARKYLEAIKLELEGNAFLARDYPGACGQGPVWRQDRIRLRNGVLLEALGTGAKIRGRKNRSQRPTLVIGDDLQNNEHITSPVLRQRTWEWLVREVTAVGTADTNLLVLGTALHREGIVCKLQQTAGWRSDSFRAIVEWPRRMDLWRQWEELLQDWGRPDREERARAFYEQSRAAMEEGAVVLWPEWEPLYALMQLRAAIGTAAFESEKQGNPTNPEACEWPDAYFEHGAFWFHAWPQELLLLVHALDPSKGKDARRGDYSAWVTVGLCKQGLLWVEADLARRPTPQIIADGLVLLGRHRPAAAVVVEINLWQELLATEFLAVAGAQRLATLPLYGIDNSVPKPVRIRALAPYLAQKRLRVRAGSPGAALLVQQCRDFPVGDHDDGPDALEMAIRMIDWLLQGGQGQGGPRVLRA